MVALLSSSSQGRGVMCSNSKTALTMAFRQDVLDSWAFEVVRNGECTKWMSMRDGDSLELEYNGANFKYWSRQVKAAIKGEILNGMR